MYVCIMTSKEHYNVSIYRAIYMCLYHIYITIVISENSTKFLDGMTFLLHQNKKAIIITI